MIIGIFGLGISGMATFNFFRRRGDSLICFDNNIKQLDQVPAEFIYDISNKIWKSLDKIIVSPGIKKSHKIFDLAHNHQIKIESDIDIFLEENPNAKIIAVTGTNGKSTTVSIIDHILSNSKIDYPIGGNIGIPVLSLPMGKRGYVLELSSFQLDLLKNFNPDISVLLNITPDHIDYHGNYEEYCNAKEKIFGKDSFKIIDNCVSNKIYKKLPKSNLLRINDIKVPELKRGNTLAAYAVCSKIGIKHDQIITHINNFKGLKHRMQFIGKYHNVNFYNDSKATNTASALYALRLINNNIFWLAGGIFKEKNFRIDEDLISKVKKAYLFGRDRYLIAYQIKDIISYEIFESMEDAFHMAFKDSLDKNIDANILLAPACSSFDQFKNFQDRGDSFIRLYNSLSSSEYTKIAT